MPESLRGHFLVSAHHLRDPNFFKTAVLIVEHNAEGAMGFIVNRPSSVSVSVALAGHIDIPAGEEVVFCGGPVEPAALFMVHNASGVEDESPILQDLYVGGCQEAFEEVVQRSLDDCSLQYRVYSGCAGWAPGQMETEISRGDWHAVPASGSCVFASDPYTIWDELIQEIRRCNRYLPITCENPEWN